MSQVFPPGANWLAKWILFGGIGGSLLLVTVASAYYWGPGLTKVNRLVSQPIPFSHARHVGGNGIDCRYCHTSVETSSFAGIPPTETCMTCHSQILFDQPMLAPVQESWRTGTPMQWTRVHDLPDFVYFDHSIHVSKGVGCSTCHSNKQMRLEKMTLTAKTQTMHMRFCLECHKAPEKFVRPKSEVFNMVWEPGRHQLEEGKKLVEEYNIEVEQLINCSICHR